MDLADLTRAYKSLPNGTQEAFAALIRGHQVFSTQMCRRDLAQRHAEIDNGSGPDAKKVAAILSEWNDGGKVTQVFEEGRLVFCTDALEELRALSAGASKEGRKLRREVGSLGEAVAFDKPGDHADASLTVMDESGRTNSIELVRQVLCVYWIDETLRKVRILAFRRALE